MIWRATSSSDVFTNVAGYSETWYGINRYEDTIGRDHMAYVVLIAEGDTSDDGREDDQVNDL